MKLKIVEYQSQHDTVWDEFVMTKSVNGTIFHTRKFISYHSEDKFYDKSILIYSEENLICVIAVCKTETAFFSHKGTSGGGPIIHLDYFTEEWIELIVGSINNYYSRMLEMAIPEEVFSTKSLQPLLSTFSKNKTVTSNLCAYFDLNDELPIKNKRLITGLRSTEKQEIEFGIFSDNQSYQDFHNVLCDNLERHQALPIHNFKELQSLKEILEYSQFLYLAKEGNNILAGVWVIKANNFAWHTQYIVKNYAQGQQYVLPLLLLKLKQYAIECNKKTLSLGSCDGGINANFSQSLCDFKVKLGAKLCNKYKIINS